MITKEQALKLEYRDELHFGVCQMDIGENGAVHTKTVRARVSGKIKTWKTRPEQFQIPIKHGLYENGYLHDRNADSFHLASECGLVTDPWLKMMCTPVIGDAFHDNALIAALPKYYMDSRNDLMKRAQAVRRAHYVTGVVPPRVENHRLVHLAVMATYIETFGRDIEDLHEAHPFLDPVELYNE